MTWASPTVTSRWYAILFHTSSHHAHPHQRNILVDKDGVARLGGLGSALISSLPASWSDVTSERWFSGIAPELVSPSAFGLTRPRITKATDMFAFGMLVWEVSGSSVFRSRDIHTLVPVPDPRWKAPVCRKDWGCGDLLSV